MMLVQTLIRSRQPSRHDDAALLARMASGDHEDAVVELYARYGRRLYGLGHKLLGDATLAEELVQETFVRAWRSAARYDPGQASAQNWLLMIARRVAVDLHRRAAARPQAVARAEGDPDPLDAIPAEDELERTMSGLEVREAMAALSPAHREVLELGYDEQLTQREIAERLGVPLGTVKTRTFHALRALRVVLEERGLG